MSFIHLNKIAWVPGKCQMFETKYIARCPTMNRSVLHNPATRVLLRPRLELLGIFRVQPSLRLDNDNALEVVMAHTGREQPADTT